jgi:adenine deaminase
MDISGLIAAARGAAPADLLITDARIVNVFSGQIPKGSIAVKDGYIAGIGDYPARKMVSVNNAYVCPGLIDAHVHIESAMTSVSQFVRAVLPHGVTTVVADPHEIANVMGTDGIAYMLAAAEKQPMNIYFTLPSCVPATDMETAGAVLDAGSLMPLLSHPRVLGLGEMMNFPGVVNSDAGVLEKLRAAADHHKSVEGHAPGLSGKDLAAYLAAGITSDHESVSAAEAMEKLSLGMHIMIREATGAKNLDDLLPIVNDKTAGRIMWCTDDRHPQDLLNQGSIDHIIRRAVGGGLDPVTAVSLATISPAAYFGLHRLGAIAPGRRADLVVVPDLEQFEISSVYCAGMLAAENGEAVFPDPGAEPGSYPGSMNVGDTDPNFAIPARGRKLRVIGLCPGQITTQGRILDARIKDGYAVSDPVRDLIKLAVVERHKATGNIGLGFVSGFGLRFGAIAGSVAHDSHNIIAAGVDDADICAAVRAVIDMGGGLAVAAHQKTAASLALPIAGLMSDQPLSAVQDRIENLNQAAADLGCTLADPFMALSFLALPVIPELRLTDKGLVDVVQFAPVPLFVD